MNAVSINIFHERFGKVAQEDNAVKSVYGTFCTDHYIRNVRWVTWSLPANSGVPRACIIIPSSDYSNICLLTCHGFNTSPHGTPSCFTNVSFKRRPSFCIGVTRRELLLSYPERKLAFKAPKRSNLKGSNLGSALLSASKG